MTELMSLAQKSKYEYWYVGNVYHRRIKGNRVIQYWDGYSWVRDPDDPSLVLEFPTSEYLSCPV